MIIAASVNQFNFSVLAGIDVTQDLNYKLSELVLPLKIASVGHGMIREHVLGRKMLGSVIVLNDLEKSCNRKPEYCAGLSSSNQGISDVVELGSCVLDLVELGRVYH